MYVFTRVPQVMKKKSFDRGRNPFDGSRRRLSSQEHKSPKYYDRKDMKLDNDKINKLLEGFEDIPEPDQEMLEAFEQFEEDFLSSQEDIDPEIQEVINDNLFKLLEEDE